jgi:hypothetical protein
MKHSQLNYSQLKIKRPPRRQKIVFWQTPFLFHYLLRVSGVYIYRSKIYEYGMD